MGVMSLMNRHTGFFNFVAGNSARVHSSSVRNIEMACKVYAVHISPIFCPDQNYN